MSAIAFPSHLLVRAIATVALTTLAVRTIEAGPRSTVPSVCAFTLDIGHRYFDGIELMTALLESPRITLQTDTLGAWAPSGEPSDSAGFALHHRTLAGLGMCVSVLPASADVASEDYWDGYVQGIQSQLGESSTVSENADSANSRAVLCVFGGRTREALFIGQGPEQPAEYHVLVTKGAAIVAFVLRGPAQTVAVARDDFRFFLSRLEGLTK